MGKRYENCSGTPGDAPTSQQLSRDDRPPVLLYVVNVAWFFRLHRLHLACAAKRAGFDVHVATAPDSALDVKAIRDAGLVYHEITLARGMSSIGSEARLILSLFRLYRALRPAIVHNVTIKPVLWGTLAARAAGVTAIVNSISGLGTVFSYGGSRMAIARFFLISAYKVLFARSALHVIFENSDDLALFVKKRIVRRERAALIRGAGVDLSRFSDREVRKGIPVVILPARMLWSKGIGEFCAAARMVRETGIEARLVLVGRADPDNPSAVPANWLLEQQRAGYVEWWGHQDNMAEVYCIADIVCLPSYREGLPTVLLEGAACGCALIASDVPGCREVVQHQRTGLLVSVRNGVALGQALITLIRDVKLRQRLAAAALQKVREEFTVEEVQRETLRLYRHMLGGVCDGGTESRKVASSDTSPPDR